MIGQRYGVLVVLHEAAHTPGSRQLMYLCRCDCGKTKTARGTRLASGQTVSCGCLGYRRSSELHQIARAKVPARRRKAIAKLGAKARLAVA